jgi:hypothetical protein
LLNLFSRTPNARFRLGDRDEISTNFSFCQIDF